MGVTSSTELGASAGSSSSGTNTNKEDDTNYFGLSPQEIDHLSTLRRLVLQESSNNNTTTNQDFLMIIWQCSHLFSLNNTPSSVDSISEFEVHLMHSSPTQLELVKKRCQWLTELSSTFTTIRKMNTALEVLFNTDDFVQQVSQILVHDNQSTTLDFLFGMLSCDASEESSISAKDLIKLCFEMASLSHYILQNYTNAPTIEILEGINISSENDMIQSMANSLLDYAKSSRDNNQHDFGGYQTTTTVSSSATTSIPDGNVTKRDFSEWLRRTVSDLLSCSISKFLYVLFFSPEGTQSNQKAFPIIRSCKEITSQTTTKLKEGDILPISSHVFGTNTTPHLSPQVFAFASISKHKFGEKWYRIFAGEDDGWTFQSFERAILGYEGPTLLVVQGYSKIDNENKSVTFGAYTASKWQNKRDFFGTSDCFLYQLQPTLTVLKPLPKMGTRGGHYMYFHSNTNVSATNPSRQDNLAVGLGLGGSVRHPRLFIDSQLEEASVSHQDTSFEEGYIGLPPSSDIFCSQSFSSTVHVDSLEVYAVGDEETIRRGFQAQYQHRDIADATLRNARTVDKAAFLGDMRNGVIEAKAFAHRGQVDGRANWHLKGEGGKANGL